MYFIYPNALTSENVGFLARAATMFKRESLILDTSLLKVNQLLILEPVRALNEQGSDYIKACVLSGYMATWL